MEQITKQRVQVFHALEGVPGRWLSVSEVSDLAGVPHRSARNILPKLSTLGVLDVFKATLGHRYKLNEKMDRNGKEYADLLRQAYDVLGL